MTEFKKMLPEQSSVKVVLNGGHQELDDATIPFTIGFDESIAKKEPTHVLVIDLPDSSLTQAKDLRWLSDMGERKIYELNKIDFIQFHKAGRHHLIFILFHDLTREQKKDILQKKSLRKNYENNIYLNDLTTGGVGPNSVWYCEELVEIPQEFFAPPPPEKGLKKAWHQWVNRWFLTKPVDECEFRKRAILASTLQPTAWILGFALRLISSAFLMTILPAIFIFLLLCGGQAKLIVWRNIASIAWQFLFLYPKLGWKDVWSSPRYFDEDKFFDMKNFKIGKFEFMLPISVVGLFIQVASWGYFGYCLVFFFQHWQSTDIGMLFRSISAASIGVWHLVVVVMTTCNNYEKVSDWVDKNFPGDGKQQLPKIRRVWFTVLSIPIACYLITQVYWISFATIIANFVASWKSVMLIALVVTVSLVFGVKIFKFLVKSAQRLNAWFDTTAVGKELIKRREEAEQAQRNRQPEYVKTEFTGTASKKTYASWLTDNMSLKSLPAKVDVNEVVAPTKTKQNILRFRVGFWRLKSKVCRPYSS